MKLKAALNGTKTNPWHAMGLTMNPFPGVPRAELAASCMRVQKLGGDPIPNADYIRQTLEGYMSEEFIVLCCENFKPGEMVRFEVEFDDEEEKRHGRR